jgi:inner membrane protein
VPLPLAHSAAGVAAFLVFRDDSANRLSRTKRAALLLLVVFAANVPDLDFIPGMVVGEPNRFHHGVSHSLLASGALAMILYWSVRRYFAELSKKSLLFILIAASASHPLLDYLSIDTMPPYGVPLLWPVSGEYLISPVLVFLDVTRLGESNAAFFTSVLNQHNLYAAVLESCFAAALIIAAWAVRQPSRSNQFWRLLAAMAVFTLVFGLGRVFIQ